MPYVDFFVMLSRSTIYLIALLFFFLFGSRWTEYSDAGFSFIGALFCLFVWLDYGFNSRKPLEFFPSHLLSGLALLGIVIIGFFRDEGYQQWYLALRYFTLWALFVLWSQKENPVSPSLLVRILSITTLSLFTLHIVTSVFGSDFGLFSIFHKGNSRVTLTFGNPNYLGAFLILCLPLFIAYTATYWRSQQDLGWLMASAALAAGILVFLTGSRNALGVGLLSFTGCSVYIYRVKNGKWWSQWHWVVSGSIFALLPFWAATIGSGTYDKILAMLSGGGASEMGRLTIWTVAFERWSSSLPSVLFGRGFGVLYPLSMEVGARDLTFSLDASSFKHAHNEYLECLLEGGLFSFILLGSAFVLIFRYIYVRWKSSTVSDDKMLYFGFMCSMSSIALFSFISVATRYFVVLLPMTLLIGTMARGIEPRFRSNHKYLVPIALILCAGTLAFCYEAGRVFRSDCWLRIANEQLAKDKPAWEPLQRAVNAHPGRVEPRYDQFMEWTRSEDRARETEVEACLADLEQIIPNFKNVWEHYAFYLASIGQFPQAADVILELSEIRFYRVEYLCDVMFYRSISGDVRGFNDACYELMYRVLRAEQTSRNSKIKAIQRNQGIIEYKLVSSNDEDHWNQLQPGQIVSMIPAQIRSNRPILKYYAMAQAYIFLREEIGTKNDPRFMELMSSEDRDRVRRLAKKLISIRESKFSFTLVK